MRDIQTADAGQQKFATHRGHGVKEIDGKTRLAEHLGSHEASRTATNNGGAFGRKNGGRRTHTAILRCEGIDLRPAQSSGSGSQTPQEMPWRPHPWR